MCFIFLEAELILSSYVVQQSSSLCDFAAYLQDSRFSISKPKDGTVALWKDFIFFIVKKK